MKFIKFNIIEGKLEIINLSKTDNNKIILSNFLELYESICFVDENIILIDIIPILIIFLHNNINDKYTFNNNNTLLEPYKYKKTIESILYDNFNCIIEYKNYYNLDNTQNRRIIDYLIANISIMFSSFYRTLILSFLKFNNINDNKRNESNNLIFDYIQKLCEEFNVKTEEYKNYVENEGLLINLIENAINKKIKTK